MAEAKTSEAEPKTILWVKRLAWASAWLLLITVGILIISGWGITHTESIYKATLGLVDRRLADSIHKAANIPIAVFFLCHVLATLKLRFYRRNPHTSRFTDGILILVGILALALVLYMEFLA
jgi:hypothetical protein